MVILSSTVAPFYAPAEASVLPEIASDDELAAAKSMMGVSSVGALTVGYGAAGLLASEAAITRAFYLDAATFLGAAVCVAAITGMPRTATVIAEQPSSLLQVPAEALRRRRSDPEQNRVFLTKMTERTARLEMLELPRFSSLDQATLRELRTPAPPDSASEAAVQPAPSTA